MDQSYSGVTTRFLRKEERLILSKAEEIPLVLEAQEKQSLGFLKTFLQEHSSTIMHDLAHYGAILLRGFPIQNEADFEEAVLSIQGLQGIREAFMSEEGRTHVGNLQYVLHTNAVYKTGGTLYLGGFHSENYYSPDVPSFISFCCLQPSQYGGETGLIHMEKVTQHLSAELLQKLESQPYLAEKWLVSEIAKRYHISAEKVADLAKQCALPLVGTGKNAMLLLYKPSIFLHPILQKKSLQINLFELSTLNQRMRKYFLNDYPGKKWFWHRFVWRLPNGILKAIERIYIILASFLASPKTALSIANNKRKMRKALRKHKALPFPKVEDCFSETEVEQIAKLLREYYSSCLWQKGDILLIDNRLVLHAGMPGKGARVIRALIANPIPMCYSEKGSGLLQCQNTPCASIGSIAVHG